VQRIHFGGARPSTPPSAGLGAVSERPTDAITSRSESNGYTFPFDASRLASTKAFSAAAIGCTWKKGS